MANTAFNCLRSASTAEAMSGYWSLQASGVPSRAVARCTCPSDAAAAGSPPEAPGAPPASLEGGPLEDAALEEDGPPLYDTVFTSPPYFDFEIYADAATQSCARHPTLARWLDGWLEPVLRKAWAHLAPRGHLALHVCDPRLVEPLFAIVGARLRGEAPDLARARALIERVGLALEVARDASGEAILGVRRDAADVSFLTSFGMVDLCEKDVQVARD